MAKNESRSLNAELQQGTQDSSYIQVCPNWVNQPPRTERLSWPSYARAERRPAPPSANPYS